MEHGNNIDMMTLSWFVPEIRESLQHVAHALDELRAVLREHPDATLLFAAHDEAHNNAVVLKELLGD